MKLDVVGLSVARLAIPLRISNRHALAERAMGDSILVRVRDSQGRVGIGECAPRSYVT
jgi:hypothetical protein